MIRAYRLVEIDRSVIIAKNVVIRQNTSNCWGEYGEPTNCRPEEAEDEVDRTRIM